MYHKLLKSELFWLTWEDNVFNADAASWSSTPNQDRQNSVKLRVLQLAIQRKKGYKLHHMHVHPYPSNVKQAVTFIADLKVNLLPCAVKHEGDEGRQDGFRGGQTDAKFNDTLYSILDGKSKWFQFNIPIRVVKNG